MSETGEGRDVTALAEVEGNGVAIAPRVFVRPAGLMRLIAQPAELIEAQNETRALIEQALKKGRDYGVIPGVDKPSLLKPGAERVTAAFGCVPSFRIVDKEIDHDRAVQWVKRKKRFEGRGQSRKFVGWDEERGESVGLYRYVVMCDLVQRETGVIVGSCPGSCSTMESKYVDRPRDSENTVLKMAAKRAHVGAVLVAFGLSEQFTQDVEEDPGRYNGEDETGEPRATCPVCGGGMWDNREGKTNPKAPDFKCKDKKCDGLYWSGQWPPRPTASDEQAELLRSIVMDLVDPKVVAKLTKDEKLAARSAEKIMLAEEPHEDEVAAAIVAVEAIRNRVQAA